jgi:hypothetical protein
MYSEMYLARNFFIYTGTKWGWHGLSVCLRQGAESKNTESRYTQVLLRSSAPFDYVDAFLETTALCQRYAE